MNKDVIRMEKMAGISEIKKGSSVLDLGCKDMSLNKFLPPVFYIGIDMEDVPKFWVARMNLGGNITGDTIFIKHNLEKGLPRQLKNKKFDVIFMGEFIEHIENFRSLLKECEKVLKEEGRIIISIPYAHRIQISECEEHIHSFNTNNIRNLARICGLKLVKMVGTYIHIPVLHFNIPSNNIIYTNQIIYELVK